MTNLNDIPDTISEEDFKKLEAETVEGLSKTPDEVILRAAKTLAIMMTLVAEEMARRQGYKDPHVSIMATLQVGAATGCITAWNDRQESVDSVKNLLRKAAAEHGNDEVA